MATRTRRSAGRAKSPDTRTFRRTGRCCYDARCFGKLAVFARAGHRRLHSRTVRDIRLRLRENREALAGRMRSPTIHSSALSPRLLPDHSSRRSPWGRLASMRSPSLPSVRDCFPGLQSTLSFCTGSCTHQSFLISCGQRLACSWHFRLSGASLISRQVLSQMRFYTACSATPFFRPPFFSV